MTYDLVISDFDGTLGRVPGFIEPETVQAIKDYVSNGGIFSVVTGRSYSSISAICQNYGLLSVVASFQGASIIDLKNGKEIFSGGLSLKRAMEIIKDLKSTELGLSVWANDVLYYDKENSYTNLYENKLAITKCVKLDNICDLQKINGFLVQKIVITVNPEQKKTYEKFFQERYGSDVIVNSGAKKIIEIIDARINKGFAVKKIAEYFNVPLSRVLAVGDSSNDLELLSGEWHGVAVGNADEELKNIAKEITVPFLEQPIKLLLEKYG